MKKKTMKTDYPTNLRCAHCGDDRIIVTGKIATCSACSYSGSIGKFIGLAASYKTQDENRHWRDPVAMTMDEYDE